MELLLISSRKIMAFYVKKKVLIASLQYFGGEMS